MVSKVFEHPFDLTKVWLQAQVLDSQASLTLPSYMMRSPVANPMVVSKCSGSRVQVDAVTRCVGRECGFDVCLCLGLGRLGCCWWRGWRRQGRAVKRSGTRMRGSCVGPCRRIKQQSAQTHTEFPFPLCRTYSPFYQDLLGLDVFLRSAWIDHDMLRTTRVMLSARLWLYQPASTPHASPLPPSSVRNGAWTWLCAHQPNTQPSSGPLSSRTSRWIWGLWMWV
jgi:hypothetical protein